MRLNRKRHVSRGREKLHVAAIFYVAISELNYPSTLTRQREQRGDHRSQGVDGNVAPYIPNNALGSVQS